MNLSKKVWQDEVLLFEGYNPVLGISPARMSKESLAWNSQVSNSLRPLDTKTKDAFIQGVPAQKYTALY